MALNQSCLGKLYPPITTAVTLAAMQNYARACNDDNPRYFAAGAPGAIVAPPMFAVVVTWLSVITAMTDADLHADLLRLLHVAQDLEFLAPIRAGDSIASTGKIASIQAHQNGETLALELEARNARGEAVTRIVFTVFIRGRRAKSAAEEANPEEANRHEAKLADEAARGAPLVTVAQTVDGDQTVRYADASGDRNPIHVDADVAKMAGLPGIIVHGLCTMAFTARVIIDGFCAGDPTRLKRLAVRFSRPVLPGETITTRVWPSPDPDGLRPSADLDQLRTTANRDGLRTYTFETCNPDGFAVIRDGFAAVSS
jgi:acyl dehydratase